jgi:hypothetical protein
MEEYEELWHDINAVIYRFGQIEKLRAKRKINWTSHHDDWPLSFVDGRDVTIATDKQLLDSAVGALMVDQSGKIPILGRTGFSSLYSSISMCGICW